jgi:hypothetical protein
MDREDAMGILQGADPFAAGGLYVFLREHLQNNFWMHIANNGCRRYRTR